MNGYREETSAWLRSSALGLGLVRVRSFADCSLIGAPNQEGLTGGQSLTTSRPLLVRHTHCGQPPPRSQLRPARSRDGACYCRPSPGGVAIEPILTRTRTACSGATFWTTFI